MATAVKRTLSNGLLSAGSSAALVGGMAVIDETFRRTLTDVLHGQYSFAVAIPDLRLQHVMRVVSETTGFSSPSQGPIALFVALGLVLFLLMFKT